MTVPSLDRLSVVDAAGEVFAYLYTVEDGTHLDAADLLVDVVAHYSVDDLGLGRAVLLPAPLAILRLDELSGLDGVEVAFVVESAALVDEQVAEHVRDQRARGRAVFVTHIETLDQVRALEGEVDGILLEAARFDPDAAAAFCTVAAHARLGVLVTGVVGAKAHHAYVSAGAAGSCGGHTLVADLPDLPVLSTDRITALRLVSLLSDPDYQIERVEEVVRADAGLSWRLLQLVNSAASGQQKQVVSLRQALVVVGRERLRDWVSLKMGADGDIDNDSDRELAAAVLIRARFCEEITALVPEADAEEGFLAGMLSGIVDILGVDVDTLLGHITVGATIERALRADEGPLAVPMSMIRSPSVAVGTARQAGLDPRAVTYAYLDAVSVAGRMLRRSPDAGVDASRRRSEIGRRLSLARWNEPSHG